MNLTEEQAVEAVSSLRDSLRADVLTREVSDLIRDSLLEALKASKQSFTTCTHCKHRIPVVLPDLGTRTTAITKLLEEVDGKLQAAREDTETVKARAASLTLEALRELTDHELAQACELTPEDWEQFTGWLQARKQSGPGPGTDQTGAQTD